MCKSSSVDMKPVLKSLVRVTVPVDKEWCSILRQRKTYQVIEGSAVSYSPTSYYSCQTKTLFGVIHLFKELLKANKIKPKQRVLFFSIESRKCMGVVYAF